MGAWQMSSRRSDAYHEVLFDIRKDTRYIVDLLEENDGEEEAEDT
jgi:hypothetical protein